MPSEKHAHDCPCPKYACDMRRKAAYVSLAATPTKRARRRGEE